MILEVVLYPATVLLTTSNRVTQFDDSLKQLANDMIETMYYSHGIGLAGNQVNELKRIAVVDVSENQNEPTVFINPEITSYNGEVSSKEGCLSIPDFRDTITRHEIITVKYDNLSGEQCEIEADGMLAICLQHEIDHLNGILFTDHLTSLKKHFFKKWLKKNLPLGKE